MATLFEDLSNKFRGENQITEIIFSSIWGNFVLYERALLLLFLLHCCWMRVNLSKYQVHQLITIALHIERSMCRRLVRTLFEDVSNKFRGENQITDIIFSSICCNFVMYERALLLLFLLHCCWMRVNVSKCQVHRLITIALHIERFIWMPLLSKVNVRLFT